MAFTMAPRTDRSALVCFLARAHLPTEAAPLFGQTARRVFPFGVSPKAPIDIFTS